MTDRSVTRSVTVVLVAIVAAGMLAGGAFGATNGGYATQADNETGNETGNVTAGDNVTDDNATADNVTADETAQVRVVHASPDAPPVDVLVDNETVLTAIELGDVSDYLALDAGEHTVTITTAENGTEVLSETVTVEAGTNYTVAAAGEVSEGANTTFGLQTFVDDPPETSAENATVRLVHLSPDAPAVDVVVNQTGAVLFENVSYGNESDYVTVPAGRYTLQVQPAGTNETVAEFDVGLEDDSAYTAFAVGYVDPPETAPANATLDLAIGVDRAGPEVGVGNGEMTNVTVDNETEMNETMGNETNATAAAVDH